MASEHAQWYADLRDGAITVCIEVRALLLTKKLAGFHALPIDFKVSSDIMGP